MKKNQLLLVIIKKGEVLKTYSLPVGAHISVKEGDKATLGQILSRFHVLLVNLVILQGSSTCY